MPNRRCDIDTKSTQTLAPLSGLLFVLLLVTGIAVLGNPGYKPTADEAIGYFVHPSNQITLGTYLARVSSLFFILFGGVVYQYLSKKSTSGDAFPMIAFGGAIFSAVAVVNGYSYFGTGGELASQQGFIDQGQALMLYELYTKSMAGNISFGLAAFIGATGFSLLRSPSFPRWFAWVGVISAIGLITPLHPLFEAVALLMIVYLSLKLYAEGRPKTLP